MEETTSAVFRRMSHNQGRFSPSPNTDLPPFWAQLKCVCVGGGGVEGWDFEHWEMMLYSAGQQPTQNQVYRVL